MWVLDRDRLQSHVIFAQSAATHAPRGTSSTTLTAAPHLSPSIDATEQKQQFEKHKKQGNDHFAKEEFDQAIVEYELCKKINPSDPVPWSNCCQCLIKLKQWQQAEREADEGIRLARSSDHAAVHRKLLYRRAVSRHESGRSQLTQGLRDQALLQLNAAAADCERALQMVRLSNDSKRAAEQSQIDSLYAQICTERTQLSRLPAPQSKSPSSSTAAATTSASSPAAPARRRIPITIVDDDDEEPLKPAPTSTPSPRVESQPNSVLSPKSESKQPETIVIRSALDLDKNLRPLVAEWKTSPTSACAPIAAVLNAAAAGSTPAKRAETLAHRLSSVVTNDSLHALVDCLSVVDDDLATVLLLTIPKLDRFRLLWSMVKQDFKAGLLDLFKLSSSLIFLVAAQQRIKSLSHRTELADSVIA